MPDSLKEARDAMGGDSANFYESRYGSEDPFAAMDMFYLNYRHNNVNSIEQINPPEKLIRAVANMDEVALKTWVHKMASSEEDIKNKTDENPLSIFEEYESLARNFRDQCRELLGKEYIAPKVQ